MLNPQFHQRPQTVESRFHEAVDVATDVVARSHNMEATAESEVPSRKMENTTDVSSTNKKVCWE